MGALIYYSHHSKIQKHDQGNITPNFLYVVLIEHFCMSVLLRADTNSFFGREGWDGRALLIPALKRIAIQAFIFFLVGSITGYLISNCNK